jgi:uncharacterized membrane protein YccC
MAAPTTPAPVPLARHRRSAVRPAMTSLRPTWSTPAAYRAVRAAVVMPGLFALTYQVIGNLQMATFAAFGSFATLVLATFGGTRRNKLVAHLGLGVAGSVLLVIGTAVNSSTALAAVVTVPVVFCVLFAGIAGPNAASGATAALLAYVLPAASPGTIGMVPARLAGWWLATAVGTAAVLAFSPPAPANRLRAAAADCATALTNAVAASLAGRATAADTDAAILAKHNLMAAFAATPYRPIGLARADQALARLVEALEWCTSLVTDMMKEGTDLTAVHQIDRDLLQGTGDLLRDVGKLLQGADVRPAWEQLGQLQVASADRVGALTEAECGEHEVHVSFHARIVATAARAAAVNALVASGRSYPAVEDEILLTQATSAFAAPSQRWSATLRAAERLAGGHASLRSVWFVNSARGAFALAAAIAIADLANVQHGFWVVLGTLSVLRTNAASTGSTALRALVGTAVGFFVGAGFILLIGDNTTALWAALPVAVLIAGYAPGTAPFAIGQAAFTATISILYNILVPVGWHVGVLRVEDVAIGAAVSVVVGVLFWPRGVAAVVAEDLADAYHDGGVYLVQATAWAVGNRDDRPDSARRAENAGIRLDDALRGLLAEQGTKRVPKEDVWRLVGGSMRLRLTAESLADVSRPENAVDPARNALVQEAARLAGWCDGVAARLGHASATVARELASSLGVEAAALSSTQGYLLWVRHHLDHFRHHLGELEEPVAVIADRRALPWWR